MAIATKTAITLEVDSELAEFYEKANETDRVKIGWLFVGSLRTYRDTEPDRLRQLPADMQSKRNEVCMTDEEIDCMVKEEIRAYRAGH